MSVLDRLASPLFTMTHWKWIAFFIIVLLSLRLFLALTHGPHLGIDGGAYILSALEVQGKDSTTVGFGRPPLAPGWLLVPFIELWGMNVGYKIWTVVFSVLPLLPVYLLTRTLVNKSAAIFALAFFSVDMMQMEMMVTGSFPLIAFTFLGLALWSIFNLAEGWSPKHFWVLVLSIGLIPYINQTTAGIAAIVIPLSLVSLFISVRREKGKQKAGPFQVNLIFFILPALLLGSLLALGSLPWYLANLPGNGELRFPGPLIIPVQLYDPALLLQAPLVVFLVVCLWRTTNDFRIRALTVLIGVLGFMILFLSYDEAVINLLFRPRYFLGILIYPAIAYLLCRTFPLLPSFKEEWPTVVPMVACWLALLWGQVVIFDLQTNFKDMIFPETAKVLQIAKSEHPDKGIITNAYSLSHWVAAVNQVDSPNTWSLEPSPYYAETDRHVRCLLGWIEGCDPGQSASDLDVKYILIDERMPDEIRSAPVYGALSEDEWGEMPNVPWLTLRKAYGTVKLWEIEF